MLDNVSIALLVVRNPQVVQFRLAVAFVFAFAVCFNVVHMSPVSGVIGAPNAVVVRGYASAAALLSAYCLSLHLIRKTSEKSEAFYNFFAQLSSEG